MEEAPQLAASGLAQAWWISDGAAPPPGAAPRGQVKPLAERSGMAGHRRVLRNSVEVLLMESPTVGCAALSCACSAYFSLISSITDASRPMSFVRGS